MMLTFNEKSGFNARFDNMRLAEQMAEKRMKETSETKDLMKLYYRQNTNLNRLYLMGLVDLSSCAYMAVLDDERLNRIKHISDWTVYDARVEASAEYEKLAREAVEIGRVTTSSGVDEYINRKCKG